VPLPATGLFLDVPVSSPLAPWIEQLAREGITGGCGSGNFCPANPVNRAQMAVFLLVAKYGMGYAPPPATGTVFTDVPANGFAAAWIEQLVREGITGGCGGGNYCPTSTVNRAQMAVFLSAAFRLGLTFLATDHLGTPNLATAVTGRVVWEGGFEPFGEDWNGAQAKGVFLRFPGQWEDGAWENTGVGSGLAYNVHRWYGAGTGRYERPDPMGFTEGDLHLYTYVMANPNRGIDPLGFRTVIIGAGKFCLGDNCKCPLPVMVLGEDSHSFVNKPAPGGCVEADAVYTTEGILKVPDNYRCTFQCNNEGQPTSSNILDTIRCSARPWIPGTETELFRPGSNPPRGWPSNPLAGER
jgi:RHS repeat-associated protein